MPYRWQHQGDETRLELWPHRSLHAKGFVIFIAATALLASFPLIAMLGSPALWVLLVFIAGAISALWYAIRRNAQETGSLREVLILRSDLIRITHTHLKGPAKEWQANPYWLQPRLIKEGGPVPHYLVIEGGPREIELGRFLSEDERIQLAQELHAALSKAREPQ